MTNKYDYPSDEELATWPNCATPDCQYKCCRIMDSPYCSRCSAQMRGLTREQWSALIAARREELFGKGCDDEA